MSIKIRNVRQDIIELERVLILDFVFRVNVMATQLNAIPSQANVSIVNTILKASIAKSVYLAITETPPEALLMTVLYAPVLCPLLQISNTIVFL